MRSIERHVTLRLLAGQVLIVGTVVGGIWWLGSRSLTETFDARLDEKVRTLATLVRQEGPLIELAFSEQLMPGYSREADPEYFQVWIVDAGTLERSDTLGEGTLEEPDVPAGTVVHGNTTLPDGRSGRQAAFALPVHEYEPVDEEGRRASRRTAAVVVAISRGPLDRQLMTLGLGLLGMSIVLVGLSAVLIRVAMRRGVRPVAELARRIAAIDHPSQSPDLAALQPPREIEPVIGGVARMLERLSAAFDREKRLSGTIAHELRTPVAELQTAMDVALLSPSDTEGLRRAAHEAREIAGEMERTVSALLRVWRGEQEAQATLCDTSFGSILRAALSHSRGTAERRQLSMEGSVDDGHPVAVPERPLALVVGNLVSNAAAHATAGSSVRWTTRPLGDSIEFHLVNEHELDLDAATVTEPFVSTGDREEHAGLGLSLSRALCEASGMQLSFEITDASFGARLTVPASTASGAR